jgi:hypothetical protein
MNVEARLPLQAQLARLHPRNETRVAASGHRRGASAIGDRGDGHSVRVNRATGTPALRWPARVPRTTLGPRTGRWIDDPKADRRLASRTEGDGDCGRREATPRVLDDAASSATIAHWVARAMEPPD